MRYLSFPDSDHSFLLDSEIPDRAAPIRIKLTDAYRFSCQDSSFFIFISLDEEGERQRVQDRLLPLSFFVGDTEGA